MLHVHFRKILKEPRWSSASAARGSWSWALSERKNIALLFSYWNRYLERDENKSQINSVILEYGWEWCCAHLWIESRSFFNDSGTCRKVIHKHAVHKIRNTTERSCESEQVRNVKGREMQRSSRYQKLHPNHLVETRILGVDRCSVPWQRLSFYNALSVS